VAVGSVLAETKPKPTAPKNPMIPF
jgi:hypothetical protein